jgi:phenylalanyl-tRNA synthetase beta chain
MKISESWLRSWCDFPGTFEEWAGRMTAAGLEVNGPRPVNPGIAGVVTARIVSAERHPDAERLQVCQVDCGAGSLQQIVCGAPNARAGLMAVLARPGAQLPGGKQIGAARLRGVESAGMLCGASELGLEDTVDGLLELPDDTPVGQDFTVLLGLDDAVCELELTPNRADCLSVKGVARETLAVYGLQPAGGLRVFEPVAASTDETFPVVIEAAQAAPRFCLRVIRGIRSDAESPLWLVERLRRAGIRAIHPVVDATNHVMLELGQPTHAYDLAKLQGPLRVRWSTPGERFELLDGQQAVMDADTLLIADDRGPLGLAGIMGGRASAVAGATTDLLLEAAFFQPTVIAGRARRHGLHTDASHRFERGVDPEATREAMEALTALILSLCGGSAGPLVEHASLEQLPRREPVPVRATRVARVLGASLAAERVQTLLAATASRVQAGPDDTWTVTPPSHRFDLSIEADYIEEVARLHGYDALPVRLPTASLAMLPVPETRRALRSLQQALVHRGYREVINFAFTDSSLQKKLDPGSMAVKVTNPIASDLDVMRTSLWPGLVRCLQTNLNRQQRRLRIFETGHVFAPGEGAAGGYREHAELALLAAGANVAEQWGQAGHPVDFFDLKGDIETLMGCGFDAPDAPLSLRPETHPALHPGQSARILAGDRPVGWLGRLHPALEASLDLAESPVLACVELSALENRALPRFEALSRFPASRRDLALLMDAATPAARLLEVIRRAGGNELREVGIFDVYTGQGIESGRKSVALSLIFQGSSSTLSDEDIEASVARVVQALSVEAGANVRG